jgi:hypothetical protein
VQRPRRITPSGASLRVFRWHTRQRRSRARKSREYRCYRRSASYRAFPFLIPAASAFASGEGRGGFTSRRRRKASQRVHSLRPPKSRSWLNREGRSWIASARSNGWPVRACRCPSESERNSAVRLEQLANLGIDLDFRICLPKPEARNGDLGAPPALGVREQRQKRRAPCTIPMYYRLLELSPEAGEKHIRRSWTCKPPRCAGRASPGV